MRRYGFIRALYFRPALPSPDSLPFRPMTVARLLLPLVLAFGVVAGAQGQDPPELRALWVDAFHEGIRSPAEADTLIAAARRANINTLIVQVRRRGDALYTKTVEPPLDDR